MRREDFQFMYRGKVQSELQVENVDLLQPIRRMGEGRTRALLLLHGFSSSPAVYRHMTAIFAGYDAVFCPVLPGHGDSVEVFSQVKKTAWLTAAETACAELCKTFEYVDVLGLSLGGLLACHLSARFPLNHLYLLAPALALYSPLALILSTARVMYKLGLRHIRNRAGSIYTQGEAELAYRQLPISTAIELLTLIKTFPFQLPTCPTDVFLGRFDHVVDGSLIAKRFANQPHIHVHWLAHSAHVLPLDGDVRFIEEVVMQHNHSL